MDINDALDDLTDDDAVIAHRARAKAELDQIAQHVRQALTEQGIDVPVFFIMPRSGDSVLTFGTITDPPDDEWSRIGEIVSSIVRQVVGLDRVRCREVMCATTHSVADHQPQASSAPPTEPSGCCSTPSLTPALQHTGAER